MRGKRGSIVGAEPMSPNRVLTPRSGGKHSLGKSAVLGDPPSNQESNNDT